MGKPKTEENLEIGRTKNRGELEEPKREETERVEGHEV